MIKSILKYFNEGNIFYALEVCEIDHKREFYLLEIKRKKNEVFITDSNIFYDLQEITLFIKKGIPLLLTLNSNSVLTKKQKTIQSNNIESLVDTAFPNLDFNLFYYEVIQQPVKSIISIVKKETIESDLITLENLNINVVDITLSISKLPEICKFLDDSTYSFSKNKIEIENNQISTIVTSDEKNIAIYDYEINSLKVNSKQVLNLSFVISFINKSVTSKNNFEDKSINLNSEYKNKRHFKILFNLSVFLILSILILNFFYFNYYYSEVEELKNSLQVSSANKQKLIKVKEQVHTKEERINTIKTSENSKVTYYLDNIALYTPITITLKNITYQPLKKAIRDDKRIEFFKNIIYITGTTNSSNDYSIWIEKLERLSFINNIENIDYQYNNAKSSNFTIKILTNE